MTYDELPELHNINVLKNLGSILERGILSYDGARRIKHCSVAMAEIQDIRAKVVLPNNRKLHAYANLYINARNTMMYKRKDGHLFRFSWKWRRRSPSKVKERTHEEAKEALHS